MSFWYLLPMLSQDTYLSLYPTCPTLSEDATAIATNDDGECLLSDAGASELPFSVINGSGTYYLMVERSRSART